MNRILLIAAMFCILLATAVQAAPDTLKVHLNGGQPMLVTTEDMPASTYRLTDQRVDQIVDHSVKTALTASRPRIVYRYRYIATEPMVIHDTTVVAAPFTWWQSNHMGSIPDWFWPLFTVVALAVLLGIALGGGLRDRPGRDGRDGLPGRDGRDAMSEATDSPMLRLQYLPEGTEITIKRDRPPVVPKT